MSKLYHGLDSSGEMSGMKNVTMVEDASGADSISCSSR